jgi:hypothetical protein
VRGRADGAAAAAAVAVVVEARRGRSCGLVWPLAAALAAGTAGSSSQELSSMLTVEARME